MNIHTKNILLLFCAFFGNYSYSQYFDEIYERDSSVRFSNNDYFSELDSIKEDSINNEYKVVSYKRNTKEGKIDVVFYKIYEEDLSDYRKVISKETYIQHTNGQSKKYYTEYEAQNIESDNIDYPVTPYYTNRNNVQVIYIKSDRNYKKSKKPAVYKKPKNYSSSTKQGINYNYRSTPTKTRSTSYKKPTSSSNNSNSRSYSNTNNSRSSYSSRSSNSRNSSNSNSRTSSSSNKSSSKKSNSNSRR
jgi:hypothetical protein